MGRLQSRRLGVRRIEESRVFDCTQDIEVGEGADDGEEDNCLYRSVRCMERKRAEESTHLTVRRCRGQLQMSHHSAVIIVICERPRPPLVVRMGLVLATLIAGTQTIDSLKAQLGTASP